VGGKKDDGKVGRVKDCLRVLESVLGNPRGQGGRGHSNEKEGRFDKEKLGEK